MISLELFIILFIIFFHAVFEFELNAHPQVTYYDSE